MTVNNAPRLCGRRTIPLRDTKPLRNGLIVPQLVKKTHAILLRHLSILQVLGSACQGGVGADPCSRGGMSSSHFASSCEPCSCGPVGHTQTHTIFYTQLDTSNRMAATRPVILAATAALAITCLALSAQVLALGCPRGPEVFED